MFREGQWHHSHEETCFDRLQGRQTITLYRHLHWCRGFTIREIEAGECLSPSEVCRRFNLINEGLCLLLLEEMCQCHRAYHLVSCSTKEAHFNSQEAFQVLFAGCLLLEECRCLLNISSQNRCQCQSKLLSQLFHNQTTTRGKSTKSKKMTCQIM